MHNILITGGAGFIGSNFINYLFSKHQANINDKLNDKFNIINIDKLTYSGSLNNLQKDINSLQNYHFIEGDINDKTLIYSIFRKFDINIVINFAAESHVDNSIVNPNIFIETNVVGTTNLLTCAKNYWNEIDTNTNIYNNKLFIQISTDEVYGSLDENDKTKRFTEDTNLAPHSPYSASKAAADLIVQSYFDTYNFPTIITRCSNNYGPNQYPEKLIPLMIKNAILNKKLPVYGDGKNIRDWIFVEDHCAAIIQVLEKGNIGEVYNVGADCEKQNIEIVKYILDYLKKPHSLIEYVEDRLGHDRRYAVDAKKLKKQTNWKPVKTFEENIKNTIEWYIENI